MGVLVCRPAEGVWAVWEAEGRRLQLSCPFLWPCAPCAGSECVAFCCQQSRSCLCVERKNWKPVCCMPCAPGTCEMRFSLCGRYLFQLGSDADSIHARSTATGELICAAPVGVFPRCMRLDSTGRQILCAAGAVSEALLLDAPELSVRQVIPTRHPCFLADFWREGVVLVCAAEGEDIQTVLYTLRPHDIRPRQLLTLPGAPCALAVCAEGTAALISTREGLLKIDLRTGIIVWNCPEWALCMRVECRGGQALISDTVDGGIWLFSHHWPWVRQCVAVSRESQACLL